MSGYSSGDFYIEWRGGNVFYCQDESGKLYDAHLCIERPGWKEIVEPYQGNPGECVMSFWEGQKFAWRYLVWPQKVLGWPWFVLSLLGYRRTGEGIV